MRPDSDRRRRLGTGSNPGLALVRRRWLFPPPQGRPGSRKAPTLPLANALATALAFTFLCSQPALVSAQALSPATEYDYQSNIGVCKSIDIRNSLDTFQRLRGCRVIEGFLQILLFDNVVNETALAEISFPEVTEITDYLLLYRVNGLRSIGQLFPNLAVIRGQTLFYRNNAFVIFEMSSLQEIGLYHLTNISRGNVWIDKNPSLCFLNSIDWSKIILDGSEPYVKSLKPENECPICTSESADGDSTALSTKSALCKNATKSVGDSTRLLCWNRQHCQKICPPHCPVCNDRLQCCSPLCIGGCSNDDVTNCTVCKDYSMGFRDGDKYKRKCLRACPQGYYKYLDRRCVTREECLAMQKPLDPQPSPPDAGMIQTHKIFNGSCIFRCPTNYMDDTENFTCQPCQGRCKKLCPPVNVDSISLVEQLRGCTHITGSLEIQIRGGNNVVQELENNLSMIEEIYGYLKVVRSFSLVSLNFFKSLRRIKGESLDSGKYVFIVMDNQNLQELWDWKNNRTLQIDRGSLFFHFNPKLCFKKIKVLQEKAHLMPFTDLEVAPNSNGDKIACEVEELNVTITKVHHKAVVFEWPSFELLDHRKLLGYIVYSTEAPYRNVTVYDGRDACGQDNWRVDDVAPSSSDKVNHILTNLEPYTQYAIYVKTYTIASEEQGAQSKIFYVRTKPDMPTAPRLKSITSNSSDSLFISWLPPQKPNGNLTHYIVSGRISQSRYLDSKDRNFCKEPPTTISKQPSQSLLPTPPPKNDTCPCKDSKQMPRINESEEFSRIRFEDELQNQVYVKKTNEKSRKKRDKPGLFKDDKKNGNESNTSITGIYNVTENGTKIWESFSFPVFGSTEFYINRLRHFTMYDIHVQACREREENDPESACSSPGLLSEKTQMKPGADRIHKVQITNQSLDTVTIQWDQPQDPNGVIYTINVEYKRVDIENARAYTDCITVKDFKNDSVTYTINKLYPGNYSLRLWATSSASLLSSTAQQAVEYSDYIYFSVEEPSSNILTIVVSLTFIIGLVVSGAMYMFYRRQKEKDSMRLIPRVNPEYVPSVYVPDEWEVPRKNIELLKELGQGSFGMVWEGTAHDIKGKSEVRCAVKTVNEHATNRERLEFLNEASVMKAFDTAHVVRLLGVVSQGQPTLVIMELMAHGDLKSYLRSHRPDADTFDPQRPTHPPSLKQILQMAIEIADGMAYLAAKKFVHRDLAARNCMVSDCLTVKIGDFGMTRDIYETDYYRKGTKGLLPVRWMAPESLKDGIFTSCSDVWSYGVVLWEMATLASQPYQGLSNDMVLRYVIDGGVMERPDNCPDKLYALMRCCWQHKPSARPSFLKLCALLLDDADQDFSHVSFYHSPAGVEARSVRPAPSPGQDDPTTPLRNAVNRLSGYTPSDSQESDELDIDTHHHFPSISESTGVTTTANGYISGGPTNGAASTQ